MMDDSKKRFQIGFIGSLGFHLFVFLVLAFAGLFAANHVDDKIVEIAVFGGGGGGGGGGGSGMKPADATEADLAAAKANALQNKQHSASQPQQQIKKSGHADYQSADYVHHQVGHGIYQTAFLHRKTEKIIHKKFKNFPQDSDKNRERKRK